MISRICRIPGRSITRSLTTTQTTSRFYSSSYRDNDRNSNGSSNSSNNKDNDQTNQVPTTQQQQQQQSREQDEVVREQLSFMPVVNMPEAEFAHNAFFSLHRPLLGLSADDERPFFTSTNPSRPHHPHGPNKIQKMLGIEQPIDEEGAFSAEEEEMNRYMMNLRPFEPPQSPNSENYNDPNLEKFTEDDGTVVSFSFEDGHSAYDDIEALHVDQTMPIFHMPDSDEVVDYLTAMQDKLQQRQEYLDTQVEEYGRRRGSNRPTIHASTAAEAKKRTMWIQQYRQRTRRQRSISMIDRKQQTK